MLAEAILKKAFVPVDNIHSEVYELPENLKKFFAGKEMKKSCCSVI
jgi:hypothetical protein